MARLPTRDELGALPSARSGRPIATYDTSAIGRGIASLGQAISGAAADLGAFAEKQKQKQDQLDVARANAHWTEGSLAIENDFEADPDYGTFNERVRKRTAELQSEAAGLIRSDDTRKLWSLTNEKSVARVNDDVHDKAFAKQRQAQKVEMDNVLETHRRIYVDPATSEDDKQRARAAIQVDIQAAENSGILSAFEADAARDKYLDGADFSRGQLEIERNGPDVISQPLPPSVGGRAEVAMGFFKSKGWTHEQAAGIVGNLIGESNLTPTIRGDGGISHGIAQWNKQRLTNLRRFAAANFPNKGWQDFGVQLEFVQWELQNSEKTAGNALKNARTVDEATAAFIGFERPRGWTPDNPKAGHNYDGRLRYAAQAAGQEVNPEWYKRLSPEAQQKLINQAETRRNQLAAETRGQIDVAVNNAPVAYQNTGQYNGFMPDYNDFAAAYGPEAGAQKYNAFVASVETAETAHDMRTMSAADIRDVVEAATPKSSGEDAALETSRYTTLAAAAQSTLAAREADPASYAQTVFPNVAQAWANVDTGGSYQEAIAATVAAQEQLGVSRIAPLPKTIATGAVQSFKDVNASEDNRISAIAGILFATPDAGQRRAIFEQLVDAGLPAMTEGAFEAMARGDSGAARRLMQAAMVDVGSLPGKSPQSQDAIDTEIQSQLMDTGEIGDIYYGLSNGSAENYTRAENDAKLISNAVHLRLRQGESLTDAVNAAAKDLYGDVKIVRDGWNVNVQALVPSDVNSGQFRGGLEAMLPQVREALTALPGVASDASTADGSRAVIDAATANYAENVMAEGFFRNSGDGYVFIDPYVGAAVTGPDGQPLTFTLDDVLKAGQSQPAAPPDRQDMPDAGRPEDRGIGFLPPDVMKKIGKQTGYSGDPTLMNKGEFVHALTTMLNEGRADITDQGELSFDGGTYVIPSTLMGEFPFVPEMNVKGDAKGEQVGLRMYSGPWESEALSNAGKAGVQTPITRGGKQ